MGKNVAVTTPEPDPAALSVESSESDAVLARLGARPDAPDPATEPDRFLRWAAASDADLDGPRPLSRYLAELRRGRPDLLDAFAQVPGHDVDRYLEWARVFGREQVPIPVALVPDAVPDGPPRYRQAGVNLAGFLTAELGVGEVARRLAAALRVAHVPFATTTFHRTTNRTEVAFDADSIDRFDTNIVCVNADSWGAFAQQVGPAFFAGTHTIAVWFWETSIFPSMFHSARAGADEIWVASAYVAQILRASLPDDIVVTEFPLPIVVPAASTIDARALLGVAPGRPLFLTSLDYNSVAERKNPYGVVTAFREAFPDDHPDGPVLVVKSINAPQHLEDAERLHALAADRPDVVLHDGYLAAQDNMALLAAADCFVSLHRAEGFGFNIADAMALGVPVVATAHGGNLTFADHADTWLVPATEIPVGPGHFPYAGEAIWGDPDLRVAAASLREVAADPAAAHERARRARDRVLAEHSVARTGEFIRNHLAGVRAERERRAAEARRADEVRAADEAAAGSTWRARTAQLTRRVAERLG
jgi:glycosyltransferase involved in cell wall biosynthesis